MFLLALSVSLNPPQSSRIVGRQPRGNAVLRPARRATTTIITVESDRQTDRIRAAAMNDFGLNVNDYWTLRSGTIAEAIPNGEAKREAFEQMRARQAAQVADRKRVLAEQRLQAEMRGGGGGLRTGDTRIIGRRPSQTKAVARATGSNARAAARLFMAMAEARRAGCRLPQLLKQAEKLHALLEQAAAEEYEREQQPQPQQQRLIDAEDLRRDLLVHKLALTWNGDPDRPQGGA